MIDLRTLFTRYVIFTLVIAGLFLVMTFITEESRTFWLGMAFGTSFSLISLWLTYFQVSRIGKMTVDRKPRFTLGTVSRLLIFLLAIWVAQQLPQYFSLTGVIIGLSVTYVILLIEPLFRISTLKEEE